MYIIRGFKKRSGEIEGRKWENFSLFCTKPDDEGVEGESVATVKVSSSLLKDTFPDSSKVVGSAVEFVMEQRFYGGKPSIVVTAINIVKKGVC